MAPQILHGELGHVFALCDADQDGFLDAAEIQVLLQYLGVRVEEHELCDIIDVFSDHPNGLVSEEDFILLVRQHLPCQLQQVDANGLRASTPKGRRASLARRARGWWHAVGAEMWRYGRGVSMLWRQTWLAGLLLGQVFNPRGKSFLQLEERDRRRLARTSLDLLRMLPFLALCMAPGSSILVPLLGKALPWTLPTTFQENSDVHGEEAVYQSIRSLVTKMRARKLSQDKADHLFADYVATLAHSGGQQRWSPASLEHRLAPAVAISEKIASSTGSPPDALALMDCLTAAHFRAICSAAGLDASGSRRVLRGRLLRLLAELDAEDAWLASSAAPLSTLDTARLARACANRGIRCAEPGAEELRQLETWVRLMALPGGERVSPLLALMCQVDWTQDLWSVAPLHKRLLHTSIP